MTALGLVARTVPQLNVFTLSFPVSFFVGLSVYVTTLAFLPDWLRHRYMINADDIIRVIGSLIK